MGNHPVTAIELLTIVFIGLKVTDQIDWSWWWVCSPLWIGIVVRTLFYTVVAYTKVPNKGGDDANTQT